MKSHVCCFSMIAVLLIGGCRTWLIDRTDREVYRLIEGRQQGALGIISDARIGSESGEVAAYDRMYRFNPRPLDPEVPEPFRKPRPAEPAARADDEEAPAGTEISASIFSVEERDKVRVFGLRDVLAYAMRHGRELQDAKEDLYLAALDLSLERHLWTPQFVADVQTNYQDFPEDADPDRALSTVSEAAVTQRLPWGGQVSARIIHSLVREVRDRVSKGESGQVILDAEIPLLRGAGRIAYESRYTAERELIYAVRRYERFRRSFLVEVAADYLNLQQARAAIGNTFKSYQSRKLDWEKADFIHRMGRSRTVFDAPRAKATFRRAEADLVSIKERYESSLDRFKIRIAMSVGALLDVVDQDEDEESNALDALLPDIDEAAAAEIAITYRLDLLNSADQVDDVRRGVLIAKNRILPDLDLTGSWTLDSDSNQLRALNFREERRTWQGGVQLRIDDRKTERNAYRAALVGRRRAVRDHEEFEDTVRADVRRALRRLAEQENLRTIQALNVSENEFRVEAARAQFDLQRATNQDVVDAEDDLLVARNRYASAVAAYRVAILDFRRDTGTLRVSDDGRWLSP